jgi:hypothetical protein
LKAWVELLEPGEACEETVVFPVGNLRLVTHVVKVVVPEKLSAEPVDFLPWRGGHGLLSTKA